MTYWEALFEEGERVCVSNTCYDTTLWMIGKPRDFKVVHNFVSINPMHTSRKDDNISCYRNILLEFDSISPSEQLDIIADIPHSTLVWSGGKSYHAIISLAEPCQDRAEYDWLVRNIYKKVPQADKSAKNPSRFTRTPGAIRENGNCQDLVYVKYRVTRERLEAWLGPAITSLIPVYTARTRTPRVLNLDTYKFLANGCYGNGTGRNNMLFAAACDFARASYPLTEAMSLLLPCTDLREFEAVRTINSAYRTVNK